MSLRIAMCAEASSGISTAKSARGPHVDAHDGWLIFALPPAELGIHPAEGPTYESGMRHQITFMCDDIRTTIADLRGKGIEIKGEMQEQPYGIRSCSACRGAWR